MNLVFLDSVDRGTFGGYENWILLTADHMASKGHKVTIAGRNDSEYLRRAARLGDKVELLGLDISGDFDPHLISLIRHYLQEKKIDVLTVNFNKDVRLGGLAARMAGHTKVLWRLGLDITGGGLMHRWLTPKLVDAIVVPSEALKNQITRRSYLTSEMVQVVHNGTADREFIRPNPEARTSLLDKYNLPENAVVAVSSGRFVDQKGHVYLVEAARTIVEAVPEIRFLWLGDGPLEGTLREQITEFGLTDYFIFAGMLDSTDSELAGADMMIHPSIEEPFSHAVLEGMRAGLPIVASSVGGTPEALLDGETSLLVPACDSDSLASAVIKLAGSAELREQFGQANQERWREHFRLDKMMAKFEQCFDQLANGSGA